MTRHTGGLSLITVLLFALGLTLHVLRVEAQSQSRLVPTVPGPALEQLYYDATGPLGVSVGTLVLTKYAGAQSGTTEHRASFDGGMTLSSFFAVNDFYRTVVDSSRGCVQEFDHDTNHGSISEITHGKFNYTTGKVELSSGSPSIWIPANLISACSEDALGLLELVRSQFSSLSFLQSPIWYRRAFKMVSISRSGLKTVALSSGSFQTIAFTGSIVGSHGYDYGSTPATHTFEIDFDSAKAVPLRFVFVLDGDLGKVSFEANLDLSRSTGVDLGACTPPSITAPPQSVAISSGQVSTLTVTATGTSLSYQWYRGQEGDTSNPVGNSATFTTPALTVATSYWVRVTDSCGQHADSTPATITISSLTASVTVITNLSGAAFTINGPAGSTGTGTVFKIPNAPAGLYTVTFLPVVGYNTPPAQTQTLSASGAITFNGTYTSSGLGDVPKQLSFVYQYGTQGPIMAQTVPVTSGSQSTTYKVSAASVGNWLTAVAQNGGTTPDFVSVTVAAGLSPNTYSGTITINAGNAGQKLIPVTLVVSALPVTPNIPQPGMSVLSGRLDPNLPTIVLTHGLEPRAVRATSDTSLWNGIGPTGGTTLLQQVLGSTKANIVRYVWDDAFQDFAGPVPTCGAYRQGRALTWNAGISLSRILQGQLPANYRQKVQFVGHSLGTIVNTYALKDFIENMPNVPAAQFTALDRPQHVGKIPGGCNDYLDGFDESWFAANLPVSDAGFQLYVDNYYSLSNSLDHIHRDGVGDQTASPEGAVTYNHPNLVSPGNLDSIIHDGFDDHSGVNEWYRWTMIPAEPPFPTGPSICNGVDPTLITSFYKALNLDASLNPCTRGWNASILLNPQQFPLPNPGSPTRTAAQSPTTSSSFSSGACIFSGSGDIVCVKNGPSPQNVQAHSAVNRTATADAEDNVAAVQINIPKDARFLSFQYSITSPGSEDYASMLLDNTPIWIMTGTSVGSGTTRNSGQIPIGGYAPGQHQLTVALHQISDQPFGFTIGQFSIQVATTYPVNIIVDPPGTGAVRVTPSASSNSYVPGTVITLQATPAIGFVFTGFLDNSSGTSLASTLTVTGPISATATFAASAVTSAPSIATIKNSATLLAGPIAAGELVSVLGTGLGPVTSASFQVVNNSAPTTLAGTRVYINGVPAPILYASATQVNAIVPWEIAGATAQVQVEYTGTRSPSFNVSVVAASPGVFPLTAAGQAAAINQDGTINGPTNPALAGSVISIYGTGTGLTSPPSVTGSIPLVAASNVLPAMVTINNVGAPVQYAGAAPGLVSGATVIKAQIPAGTPAGTVPLTLGVTVNGSSVSGNPTTIVVAGKAGVPGPPAGVAVVSGAGQVGPTGQPFGQPLVVRVRDASGVPVGGVTVTWKATGPGLLTPALDISFQSAQTVTDALGQASVSVRADSIPGSVLVTASISGGLAATFSLTVAPGSVGPNLVVNSSFDRDLSGWSTDMVATHSAVWASLDASGSSSSGSMRLVNQEATSSGAIPAWQCIPVAEGATYSVGASVYIPQGQIAGDWVAIEVIWSTDDSCQHWTTGAEATLNSPGVWTVVTQELTAPAGTRSALFSPEINKTEAGGNFQAFVDEAYFRKKD